MIIRSHSVPALPSGLSPMQECLLRSAKPVRLVSAPTGAGKSFAFMRAVIDEDAQVLFIAPTKRLLQNLIEDAREQARQRLGKSGLRDSQIDSWIYERIIEWSGNQTVDGCGSANLSAARARQLLAGGARLGGRVIFAIPEVVVTMMSGIRLVGASAVNPFLYVRRFDHVVFDEFHTIDDRAFGLACLFSLLAVTERRAKVSLLSATPIDVTKVLEQIGVASDQIDQIGEQIVDGHPPGHRPIHGNVAIAVRDCSLLELATLDLDAIRAAVARRSTVIVIYDSLERLKREERPMRRTFIDAGVSDARILAINSIDDSARGHGEPRRGRRYEDPRRYDVLICTSSIEVGVTFHSTLMFTEPGHELASFVQRVGRVSRGAEDGRVVVSLSGQRRGRHAWTRRIATVVEQHGELDVQTFVGEILRDVRRRFEPAAKEAATDADGAQVPFYRRVSWRGLFWAALFIVAIRRTKMNVQVQARARLRALSPTAVQFVDARIGEILAVDVVNENLRRQAQPHRQWVEALLASALTYRDIGSAIVVVDPTGMRRTASESFLRRSTNILDRYSVTDEDGERTVYLMARTLDQEIAGFPGKRDEQPMELYVRSPIGDGSFSLAIAERDKGTERLNARLIEEWRHRFGRYIPGTDESVRDPRMKVMGAATSLVEKLGRPPLDEDYESAAESTSSA